MLIWKLRLIIKELAGMQLGKTFQGKARNQQQRSVIWNKGIRKETKGTYKTIVEILIRYNSKVQEVAIQVKRKLKLVEMNFQRRSCGLTGSYNELNNRRMHWIPQEHGRLILEKQTVFHHVHDGRKQTDKELSLWQKRSKIQEDWKEAISSAMTERNLRVAHERQHGNNMSLVV